MTLPARALTPAPGAWVEEAHHQSRARGWLWWSKVLAFAACLLAVLAVAAYAWLPAFQGQQPAQQNFKSADVRSMQLPTDTATTVPSPTSTMTPTPPPKPTATPRRQPTPPPTSSGTVISIIQSVFGSYANDAIAVARCESGLNPSAVNHTSIGGSHASGLFQILYPSTWNTTAQRANSPFDARANTLAAYEIFKRDGYSWREWSCKP
jgi:hypothetical protein